MIALAANQSFTYDDLNRLTSYAPSGASQAYAYDASGNRISLTIGSSAYADAVDPSSNRLLSTTGPSPLKSNVYDAAGNLTSDGTVGYGYSDRGRMASAQTGSVTVNYLYNALGQRTLKTGSTSVVPTGAVRFIYDQAGQLLGQYDAGANLIQETVYLGDLPIVVLKVN
jgi:YD repeat-containing protein